MIQTSFTVGNSASLAAVFQDLSGAGPDYAPNTAYTITLTAAIDMAAPPTPSATLSLPTGSSVTLTGPYTFVIDSFAVSGGTLVTNLDFTGAITLDSSVLNNVALTTNNGTVVAGEFSGQLIGTTGDGGDTAINSGTIQYIPSNATTAAIQFDSGTVQNGWDGTTAALISGVAGGVTLATGGLVQNGGSILASAATSVAVFLGSGTVDNGQVSNPTALISGGSNGIVIVDAGVINNDGTVIGVASDGAYLGSGNVTNGSDDDVTAQIIGGPGDNGLWIASGSGTVDNYGTISGAGYSGVWLEQGGTVDNGSVLTSTALISGAGQGVELDQPGVVVNDGTIQATDFGSQGVFLVNGGTVQNAAPAVISGEYWGVVVEGSAGIVTNFGTIQATDPSGLGVDLVAGGMVTNGITTGSTATIDGGYDGVRISAGDVGSGALVVNEGTIAGGVGVDFLSGPTPAAGTLVNDGLVDGSGGYAAIFGNGAETLVLDAGGSFVGSVLGNNAPGSTTTLELATNTQGTLSALGSDGGTVTDSAGSFAFSEFGTLALDSAAAWSLGTPGTLDTVFNAGSLAVSVVAAVTGNLMNTGTVTVDPGTLTVDGSLLSNGGTSGLTVIGSDSAVTLQAGADSNETVQFTLGGTQEYLALGSPDAMQGAITDFGQGRTLDLLSTQVTSVNYSDDTLYVMNNAVTVAVFDLPGPFSTDSFAYNPDLGTGTFITAEGTPCYCRGTLILTDRGEMRVETLQIGDRLVTLSGNARPIRWIGRRSYSGRFAAGNRSVLPVLIRSGALADNVPRRDLFVSPLHAMYTDGVLIPASALVNGRSIVQAEAVDQVDYIHLELETHDIILAEGAPSETFIDDDSRGMFHNAAEYRALYPDAPRLPARYCALRVEDGAALEAVRLRLAARAAQTDAAPVAPAINRLSGNLDRVGEDCIEGWARDAASPGEPVRLRVLDNGVVIGEVLADRYRADLKLAGIGDGCFSFSFHVPGGLSPLVSHVVRVQRASDRQDLPNSPWMVPPAAPTVVVPAEQVASLRGCVDAATRDRVSGWVQDLRKPNTPVPLQILDNGTPIVRVLANRHRGDLETAGIGDGRHAFDIMIPGGLSPFARHVIQVVRETDGAQLSGSPAVIEPVGSFDDGLEQVVAAAVTALGGGDDTGHVLSFMLAQADRLRQGQADLDARRSDRLTRTALRRPPEIAGAGDTGLRALVIDERLPVVGQDAGSQAILSHMQALRSLGYAVSFVAAGDMERLGASDATLLAQGITWCGAPFYGSVEELLRRQTGCFDVVYLHRAGVATRYIALARQFMPQARILYSVADLHHVRLARQAAIEGRPELLGASHRKRLEECMAAWSADAVLTHSAAEVEILRRAVPDTAVYQVPWHVPVRDAATPFSARHGLAFIGGYRHTPNVDAARWLVEAVMPLVWQARPDITCLLVGSDMPEAVAGLARPGVTVLGRVDDIHSVLDQIRLTAAPLRYGAGAKGKVLESFASGVPCAMSPVAAEGLLLPPPLQALVGVDAAQLAGIIVRLHQNAVVHRNAQRAGLAYIRTANTEEAVALALQQAVEGRTPKGSGTAPMPAQPPLLRHGGT